MACVARLVSFLAVRFGSTVRCERIVGSAGLSSKCEIVFFCNLRATSEFLACAPPEAALRAASGGGPSGAGAARSRIPELRNPVFFCEFLHTVCYLLLLAPAFPGVTRRIRVQHLLPRVDRPRRTSGRRTRAPGSALARDGHTGHGATHGFGSCPSPQRVSPTSALTLVGARRRLPRRLRPARRTSTAPSVACSSFFAPELMTLTTDPQAWSACSTLCTDGTGSHVLLACWGEGKVSRRPGARPAYTHTTSRRCPMLGSRAGRAAPLLALLQLIGVTGECNPFCEKKTDPWESLCTWNGCYGCSECYVPPASPPQCQGFCAAKTQPWDTRCSWAGCGGCTECMLPPPSPPAPACRSFCEDKTQAWDDKCT